SDGIQLTRSSNWNPGAPTLNLETSGSEIKNAAKAARLAQIRNRSLLFPGMRKSTASAASGAKSTMLSKCWSIKLPGNVIPQERQRSHHYEECIRLHAPGLQDAHGIREHLHEEGAAAHCAIDDPGVPPDG